MTRSQHYFHNYNKNITEEESWSWWQLSRTFLVKFVLEVLGGGGAIWGFSEACGLRTPNNAVWLWRPLALGTAVLFGLRWLWQLHQAASALLVTAMASSSSNNNNSLQLQTIHPGQLYLDTSPNTVITKQFVTGIQPGAMDEYDDNDHDLALHDNEVEEEESNRASSEATALTTRATSPRTLDRHGRLL